MINILEAHKNKKQTGDWGFGLVSGIVFLIIALIVLVFASAIVSILPIILGLVIIANGLFELFFGLNTKSKGWSLYSVLLLIGGLILLFNPFKSLMFLFQIFGAILIFMGISEIVSFFRVRKMYFVGFSKKAKKPPAPFVFKGFFVEIENIFSRFLNNIRY